MSSRQTINTFLCFSQKGVVDIDNARNIDHQKKASVATNQQQEVSDQSVATTFLSTYIYIEYIFHG